MAIAVNVEHLDRDRILDVDIFADEIRQNWLGHAADWATRPPFYILSLGIPQVVVARNKDVREVLRAPERFHSTPPAEASAHFDVFMGLPVISLLNGAPHDRIRRILQPWFGGQGIARLESEIERHVDELSAEIEAKEAGGGQIDFVWDFAFKLIPRIMLGTMFGLSEDRQAVFIRMNSEFDNVAKVGGYPADYVESFHKARALVDEIIGEREVSPSPTDFIGALIAGRNSGEEPITDDEIAAQVFAICAGAIDTVATEVTMTVYTWMSRKADFEILREQPELISQAVEEAMRLHPAGLFVFPRFAATDTEVGGTKIWKDMPVHVCVASADLDPEAYPDPLEFKIGRNPKHLAVFGAGPHFCAGSILARTIINQVVRTMMNRHPNMHLVDPNWTPRYDGQLGQVAPQSMEVRLG